jgi:2-desacetyl-2-hydroxyethyl bacteriochlorophyllide A dehydrogenase
MGTALVFEAPGQIGFVVEEDPPLAAGEVRLATLYSGISAGTELTAYRGTNPYLHRRWDADRRLFVTDPAGSPGYPLVGWGYEEVGEVIELGPGVDGVALGQRVYGIWGHRTRRVVTAEQARRFTLAGSAEPVLGIFSRIGSIALNGILDAGIHLGETVAVFGLGVIGQIVAQLARLSGARVIAVDLIPSRLELASRLGAEVVLSAAEAPAEQIKGLTGGRGADVVIESTGSTAALHEAIRACAYSSRVVALGFFQGEGVGLRLGEEFHHNRIDLVCSQISNTPPALRHRWDRDRLATTVIDLAVSGRLELQPLISHTAPFRDAAALFELLDTRAAEAMQTLLSFDQEEA